MPGAGNIYRRVMPLASNAFFFSFSEWSDRGFLSPVPVLQQVQQSGVVTCCTSFHVLVLSSNKCPPSERHLSQTNPSIIPLQPKGADGFRPIEVKEFFCSGEVL
jgi:hypothetical protein